eukprot:13165988-Heterocapsa_arctica.AAC.1
MGSQELIHVIQIPTTVLKELGLQGVEAPYRLVIASIRSENLENVETNEIPVPRDGNALARSGPVWDSTLAVMLTICRR